MQFSQDQSELVTDDALAVGAHERARQRAVELNRRLRAFESRMVEQFEALSRELDGGQGTICAELDEIERELAQCGAPAAVARTTPEGIDDRERELADLHERYEMAVSDIRDLKKQLAGMDLAGGAKTTSPVPPADGLDWESQKRRLLASLKDEEQQEPEPEASRCEERLQIEQVIRATDSIIRNKQAEIDELRERLESAESLATQAETASSHDAQPSAQLDDNEIIQQERARLRVLEAALQENLRQAEIELSVERAHLARVAAELAEKQRGLADLQGEHPRATYAEPAGKPKKPQRNWLARLGLNDDL